MNLFNNWQLLMGIFVIVGAMGLYFCLWQLVRWHVAVVHNDASVSAEMFWFAAFIFSLSVLAVTIGIRGL